jgi:hypothetical protein
MPSAAIMVHYRNEFAEGVSAAALCEPPPLGDDGVTQKD